MRASRGILAVLLAALLAGACDGDATEQPSEPRSEQPATDATTAADELEERPPFDTGEAVLSSPDGERVTMPVYVADDADKRRQGLMGVRDLPREAGMVFVYTEDSSGPFWMKNTLIPLSIAFFDAGGEVVAVLDMEPCEADPCPTYDPGVTYRGALEVNQGYFDDLGLDEQWRVQVKAEPRS